MEPIDCVAVVMNGKNYQSIEAAIHDANTSDTIFVAGSPMEYYGTHPNEVPKSILIEGVDYVFHPLEPVGQEWNGEYRPINEISYDDLPEPIIVSRQ